MNNLINELLLENWIVNISYEKFYSGCAPKVCVYTEQKRYDIFFTVLTIIAIFGGLTQGLQILAPWIVRLVFICWQVRYNRTNNEQNGEFI
jgi:hypothetical protein